MRFLFMSREKGKEIGWVRESQKEGGQNDEIKKIKIKYIYISPKQDRKCA